MLTTRRNKEEMVIDQETYYMENVRKKVFSFYLN